MKLESKSRVKNEIIMFLSLTIASAIIAFNLKSFVRTGRIQRTGTACSADFK